MKSVFDLVYSCCYKSIVDTGQFVNNRAIFLIVPEAGSVQHYGLGESRASRGLGLFSQDDNLIYTERMKKKMTTNHIVNSSLPFITLQLAHNY